MSGKEAQVSKDSIAPNMSFSIWFPSSEMAAATVQTLQREKKVWFCGSTEGRHAARACAEDNS